MGRAVKGKAGHKRVALDPMTNEFNAFNSLFTQAVARTGVETVPYQWGLRELARNDAVILHWPDAFMNPVNARAAAGQLARLLLLRRTRGLKLVWVAHNVAPHEDSGSNSFIRKRFLASLDGIIYLSHRSRELVHQTYRLSNRVVEQVTVHGRYPATVTPIAPPMADQPARVVSIGLVRPYKNLGELVTAARDLDPARIEIAIVGKRHDADYAASLEASARPGGALRFDLCDTLLSEAEIEATIDAAHGVVLPYRNILNSGSAIHALSRGRPVLVPALGSMPELARLIGEEWVQLYDGELTGKRLADFAAHLRSLPSGAQPDLSPLSWDRVTQDLKSFFERLFNGACR